MEYFTRAAYESTDSPKGRRQWHQLEKDYAVHLRSINPQLRDGWRQLTREDFEDEFIRAIDRPSFDQLVLELDSRVFVFRGVHSVRLPDFDLSSDEIAWICHEVHCVEDGIFELKVLLSEGEFRVACEEVRIYQSEESIGSAAA